MRQTYDLRKLLDKLDVEERASVFANVTDIPEAFTRQQQYFQAIDDALQQRSRHPTMTEVTAVNKAIYEYVVSVFHIADYLSEEAKSKLTLSDIPVQKDIDTLKTRLDNVTRVSPERIKNLMSAGTVERELLDAIQKDATELKGFLSDTLI